MRGSHDMDRLLQFIPFLLTVPKSNGGSGQPKLNVTRIIEAVVIAAVGGLMAGYVSMAKMEVKVDQIQADLKGIESRMCSDQTRQEKRIDDVANKVDKMLLKETHAR